MKRDLDLIRDLLFAIEASPDVDVTASLKEKGYSEEQIGFHSYLLGDAGYAKVIDISTLSHTLPQALPLNLTWKGYEFLDSARESNRWKKAKGALNKVGNTSFDVIVTLLKEYAKQELGL